MQIKNISGLNAVSDGSARVQRPETGATTSSAKPSVRQSSQESAQAAVAVRTAPRKASASRPSLVEAAKAALTGTATARLIKRVFGFKIGKLGVRYTSQNLEIDPQEVARKSAEQEKKRQASAFAGELDVADNREALAEADVEIPAEDAVQAVPTGPMSWFKKLAFALYSKNAKAEPDEKQEHKLIAVA